MTTHEPPHNQEAEEALLGALLTNPEAVSHVVALIKPDDFYIVRLGWVYEAMLNLHERREPVEYLAVCEELRRAGRLNEAGGPAFVAGLVSQFSLSANVLTCANIISDTSLRRRQIQLASETAQLAFDETLPAVEILERSKERLEALERRARAMAADAWEWRSLAQACEPKPPRAYLLQDILPLPSLSILYGAPGSLKTMLLQDLALCVAGGRPWLKPLPSNPTVGSYLCERSPVLWVDVDNGRDRIERRFAALRQGHDVPVEAPLHYVSYPAPPFVACDRASLHLLMSAVEHYKARLVVIDNLGAVSGGADENSAEMIKVMAGLRRVAETAGVAVVIVHHKSKGGRTRAGDSLRGHTSIEGAIDLVLLVERAEGAETITLKCTKSRDAPLESLTLLWSYERDGSELLSGRFFCVAKAVRRDDSASRAERVILELLEDGMNQTQVVEFVKERTGAGRNRARDVLKALVQQGKLCTREGPHKSVLYYRSGADKESSQLKDSTTSGFPGWPVV